MILVEEAWWDQALGVSGGLLGVDFRGLLPQLFHQVDFRVSLQPGSGKGVGWHQHSLGDLGFWDLVVGMFGHHHYPFLRLPRLRMHGIFQFVQPHRCRRIGLSPWGGILPNFWSLSGSHNSTPACGAPREPGWVLRGRISSAAAPQPLRDARGAVAGEAFP